MEQSEIKLRSDLAPVLKDCDTLEKDLSGLDAGVLAIFQRLRLALDPSAANKDQAESRLLSPDQQATFLSTLERRFSQSEGLHYARPDGVVFNEVKKALEANPALLWSLHQMEASGGAPDVVAIEENVFVFADCSAESPSGRRGLTYDEAAKQAEEFGVTMCNEAQYRAMQKNGKFDPNTWSWILTDAATRQYGNALYGSRDGSRVGVRHADAQYRYSFGGWRGVLRVPKA